MIRRLDHKYIINILNRKELNKIIKDSDDLILKKLDKNHKLFVLLAQISSVLFVLLSIIYNLSLS
jgi:hypothetical protein